MIIVDLDRFSTETLQKEIDRREKEAALHSDS
jgi:hypothetical protein